MSSTQLAYDEYKILKSGVYKEAVNTRYVGI